MTKVTEFGMDVLCVQCTTGVSLGGFGPGSRLLFCQIPVSRLLFCQIPVSHLHYVRKQFLFFLSFPGSR